MKRSHIRASCARLRFRTLNFKERKHLKNNRKFKSRPDKGINDREKIARESGNVIVSYAKAVIITRNTYIVRQMK